MRALLLVVAALSVAASSCIQRDPLARHVAQAAQAVRPFVPPERAAREALGHRVQQMLAGRAYDAIDSLVVDMRRSGERFDGGYLALRAPYEYGFDQPVDEDNEGSWRQLILRLELYRQARPASTVAPIALARAHVAHAWNARGTGAARKVSEADRVLFEERLERARRAIDSASPEARATLDACFTANQIALGQGWSETECDSVFRLGRSIDPACEILYVQRAIHLLPRWYGARGAAEVFLRSTLRDLPPAEADRVYAEVTVALARRGEILFDGGGGRWPRAKAGLLGLVERYPGSLERKSQLCWLASMADDWATARSMFKSLGSRADLDVWKQREAFARAHIWVQAMAARQG